MKKTEVFLLAVILLGACIVRFYRFDNPIADWHAWRQADTSAVSRNFVQNGFDLLHPRFDDLSNVPSGRDNPQGYRFVEFPIYNVAQAGLFTLFGVFTLEQWGRLVSIISSVLTALLLYLLVKNHSNSAMGLLAAFFYAFIPYNIYYGRAILPDTSMAMAILAGIYFFDLWVEKGSKQWGLFIGAILSTATALFLKPYGLFFTLPLLVISYKKWGMELFKQWQLFFFALIAVLPLILWRLWMSQYPQGIPVNAWLLNGNGIRFKPSFFRWIFYERLTHLISGYLGVIIFIFGLYKIKKLKEWKFFSSFLVSSLFYLVVFATGNVQHDYYQILIMPTVAIFYAIGGYFLYRQVFKKIPLGKIIFIICTIGLFYFGWYQVRDYFNINNRSIIIAGEAVDRLVPKDAKIIAPYNGDTSFLYQTKRKGWASFEKSLPEMIHMGAEYLVLLTPTKNDFEGFGRTYKIIAATADYIVFDLTKIP